ncbi:GNAT family N-acetyltransferase [Chitinolyticbacter albus]|uniref:GNAT family N-acetyltransferase n=1 Tax=Chitinolyticbacter albus TaxID=2961951 RepID=UPI0021096C23|nr:GNAT family N-acetyltransferase [Chitinolyticbacter albus]
MSYSAKSLSALTVRIAAAGDFVGIWPIFHAVVSRGDSYVYAPDTDEAEAERIWMQQPLRTYVAELAGVIVGTYYLKPNQPGLGDHVANAAYMVADAARGKGVASAMCVHSLDTARALGFRAMQFNFVVSSNLGAIRLWERHGFSVVGRLPGVFRHPELGMIPALVMHRFL